jgi:putative ABC transport system permease protein
LTLLGIIIGVTSVVAMFSSVNAIKIILAEGVRGLGWDHTIIVRPKQQAGSNFRGRGFAFHFIVQDQRRIRPLTYRDFEALKAEVEVKNIYGMIETWGQASNRQWLRIRATNIDYFSQHSFVLSEGRFFNDFEMKNAEKVAVVGPYFSEHYFNGECPLDKFFSDGRHRYKIIGILGEDPLNKGNMNWFNSGDRAWTLRGMFIPLKTGATYLRRGMALDHISLQSTDMESFSQMKDHVNQVLLAHHSMAKNFEFDDLNSQMLETTQQLNEFLNKWTITLIIIASISLFVGGIGLFSTLLISINERMMEIGVRKSIGAKDSDIFFYFITEALTLSVIAGIIGITLGLLLTVGLGLAIKVTLPLDIVSVYIGLIFALGVGFLSGLYPAIKASKINPIQAIYYFE